MSSQVLPGKEPATQGHRAPPRVNRATHYPRKLLKPGRIRRRILQFLLALVLLYIGKWCAANPYIPDIIHKPKSLYQPDTTTEPDDRPLPKYSSERQSKPNFHLLVTTSASTSRRNLCKCLLSAAVLDYPPPTLVNYERSLKLRRGRENVQDIYDFLTGKEVGASDLILIISEDTWLQLPPAVAIDRFLLETRASDVPKYKPKVIFAATKQCSNPPWGPACAAVPYSPLSRDLYGEITKYKMAERYDNPKYQNPRLLSSNTVIGKASDLIPMYKHALDLLRATDQENYESQQAISQIFGEQEAHRRWVTSSAASWKDFLRTFFPSKYRHLVPPEPTNPEVRNYEFGIGLDYSSSIFQIVDDSEDDLRFVTFNRPTVIASPSKLEAEKVRKPIKLPVDLFSNFTRPFALDSPSGTNASITGELYWVQNTPWSEVPLATNIIVPGSGIPSVLDFHETAKHRFSKEDAYIYNPYVQTKPTNLTSLREEWWPNMWFASHSRALMGRYLNSSKGIGAAESAEKGGREWWDMRGGRGGVWTGRGEWLDWKEVCGGVEGLYGDEGVDMDEGDDGVVRNSFGNVVEGDDKGRGFEGLRFGGGGV